MKLFLPLLALLPAHEVAVPQPVPVPDHYAWPSLPGYGGQASFTRSVAARLTGGELLHTVTRRGDDLVMLYEPSSYEAFCALGIPAYDFDVWVAGAAPDRDALMLVHDAGLLGCWIAGDPPQFQWQVEAAGAWMGATRVRCGDLDADGRGDVVGLAGDGRTLLVRNDAGGGAWSETSFQARSPVLSFELLRYLPGDRPSIAALTTAGLDVYSTGCELPGALLPGDLLAECRAVDTQGNFLAVLRQAAQPFDRLAWVTWGASGQQQVLVMLDTLGLELPAPLGAFHAVAGACGDGDGDGDLDLYLGLDSDQALLVLPNQTVGPTVVGAATTFVPQDPAGWQLLDLGGGGKASLLNQATPLLADLDGDQETDVFFPLQELNAVGFHFGASLTPSAPPLPLAPTENSLTHDSHTVTLSCGTDGGGPYADVTFQVEYHDLGLLEAPPLSPTGYRIVVWHTSDYGEEFDPQAPHEVRLDPYLGPTQAIPVRIPWDPASDALFACYVHVRPVHVDSTGTATPGPPLVAGFALDPGAVLSIWMHPLWQEQNLDPLPLDTTGGCQLSNTRIGALLLTRRTVLPDDDLPQE